MKKKNRTVWSNRLSAGNSKSFQRIGSSIHVDKRLYKEDIFASIVHTKMLIKQKIIPKKDRAQLKRPPLQPPLWVFLRLINMYNIHNKSHL